MKLSDTIILAAQTPRSNAYVQAMAQKGINIKAAVVFGESSTTKPGQTTYVPDRNWPDAPVFLPDLSVPLHEALDQVCEKVSYVTASHINDSAISEKFEELSPKLVIYSGYGAQIVGEPLLDTGIPFLHLHAGWLPDFRGSTTTYYHLLATGDCGVSAILFKKDIDTGPILARKKFPKPPRHMDIDYLYDSAIRADLLVDVLKHYGTHAELPEVTTQDPEDGDTYYVIHPVLKHIAIHSLDKFK